MRHSDFSAAFERNADYVWFREKYNSKYNELVLKYADRISLQFYGHGHTDSFKVYYNNNSAVSYALLAPAVTPWYSDLPGKQTSHSINVTNTQIH
jgi:sphingomyelin phosphodiesterase acid-like 3